MAGNQVEKELQMIVKELHELNKRLDRLCRSFIFSIDDPVITVRIPEEERSYSR